MDIYESGEMYLETIYKLKRRADAVRSVDVAGDMNHAKSSVSRAVNLLKDGGYITVDGDGVIEFTEIGLKRAKEIFERHIILTKYLKELGVSDETAEADACRIEHVISSETFEAIKRKI